MSHFSFSILMCHCGKITELLSCLSSHTRCLTCIPTPSHFKSQLEHRGSFNLCVCVRELCDQGSTKESLWNVQVRFSSPPCSYCKLFCPPACPAPHSPITCCILSPCKENGCTCLIVVLIVADWSDSFVCRLFPKDQLWRCLHVSGLKSKPHHNCDQVGFSLGSLLGTKSNYCSTHVHVVLIV